MTKPLNSKVFYKIKQTNKFTHITYWVDLKDIRQVKVRTFSLMPDFNNNIVEILKRYFPYAQDYIKE